MQLKYRSFLIFLFIIVTTNCTQKKKPAENTSMVSDYETTGTIERTDPAINDIIASDAELEILAEGFDWSEGPVWVNSLNALLFSDIPPNEVRIWQENQEDSVYLKPSGYTGAIDREGEPGSNGLLINPDNRLVLCQHGDRRIAIIDAPLDDPEPNFITLVDSYQGKRLNSPNDACYDNQGNLYFTDPPYGLQQGENDPAKELDFQGVFLLKNDGELILLTDTLTRPNGIGLLPDEKHLIVANSDPKKAFWTIYEVLENGEITNGKLFFDATEMVGQAKGLPDGLTIRDDGVVFATGPGGVWVFSSEGKHLGTINTGQATSNCTLGPDQKTLYMTADMYLMRVRLQ